MKVHTRCLAWVRQRKVVLWPIALLAGLGSSTSVSAFGYQEPPQILVVDDTHTFSEENLDTLAEYAESAAAEIVDYLGSSEARNVTIRIETDRRVPYTEDRDAEDTVVIRLPAGRFNPANVEGSRLALHHELTHAIASGARTDDRMLTEGLGVHIEDLLGTSNYPDFVQQPDEVVRELQRIIAKVPLARSEPVRLDHESGDARRLAYAQEGAFVRWLINRYGLGRFLEFYRGTESYQSYFDRTLDELEHDWRLDIDAE